MLEVESTLVGAVAGYGGALVTIILGFVFKVMVTRAKRSFTKWLREFVQNTLKED